LAALSDFRRNPNKENEVEVRELLDDLIWMNLKGSKAPAGAITSTGNRDPFLCRAARHDRADGFCRALCAKRPRFWPVTSIFPLPAPSAISFLMI
jgi:hypothetical protein